MLDGAVAKDVEDIVAGTEGPGDDDELSAVVGWVRVREGPKSSGSWISKRK